ncbi:hypothetical protein PAXRUDRAFT_155566, partial [Paxillus rubicundulus Ve08.2h10]
SSPLEEVEDDQESNVPEEVVDDRLDTSGSKDPRDSDGVEDDADQQTSCALTQDYDGNSNVAEVNHSVVLENKISF